MILSSVYLYSNRVDAYAALIEETDLDTRYNKVYNRNLKIYGSTDNRIDIRVKNRSQKPAVLGETALVFRLMADDTERLILEKDCVIKDNSRGIAYVDLTREDMQLLDLGNYYYTLTQEYRQSADEGYVVVRSVPLYTDSQFGTRSTVVVTGDVKGVFQPSVSVTRFILTNPTFLSEPEPRFRVSSIIDANPWTTKPQTLHTFQFYFSETYEGSVAIEASLDEQGATLFEWFVVYEFEPTNTVEIHSVAGRYSWFRIKHFPETENTFDPAIENELGTLDKVLYR